MKIFKLPLEIEQAIDPEHFDENSYCIKLDRSSSYQQGIKKYDYKLQELNKLLKKNGFDQNGFFELSEKRHFTLNFDLVITTK